MIRLLFLLSGILLPYEALARDFNDTAAQYLSQSFYCGVVVTMAGNTGVLIGLAIAAFGFYKLIFSGPGLGNLLLIAGGVLFTAIPTWFENGMDALGQIFSSVRENQSTSQIVTTKYADATYADCQVLDQLARQELDRRFQEQLLALQQGSLNADGTITLADGTTLATADGLFVGKTNAELLGSNATTCAGFQALSSRVLGGAGATRCSSGFGTRGDCDDKGTCSNNHFGTDLAAPIGTPVLSPFDGIVRLTGNSGAGGQRVTIENADGTFTQLFHLNTGSISVKAGDRVSAGQQVAGVGSTGSSTGPHLDVRICNSVSGAAGSGGCTDPVAFFNG